MSDTAHIPPKVAQAKPAAEYQRVVVVGTGYVGLPAAIMWAHAGVQTVGVDINENLVNAINDRTLLVDEEELNELLHDPRVQENLRAQPEPCEGDVFVIAVPTPIDPIRKIADLTSITEAVDSVARVLRPGNLVIIESTIPPLATREVIAPLIEATSGLSVPGDVLVAHCPERILPGDIFLEIVENDRLVGGVDSRSADAAARVYEYFVEGALIRTTDLIAELSKLMENTYRDVNIALANELAQICHNLGADASEVFNYANRHPRVDILAPGIGVGGHCIPIDPWFLKEVAPYDSRLISTARWINDEMPQKAAARIRREVADVDSPRIVALGAAYKANSQDQRESPALAVVDLLVAEGYSVTHMDPLVPELDYQDLGAALTGADLLVVLVSHTQVTKELESWEALSSTMRTPRLLVLG